MPDIRPNQPPLDPRATNQAHVVTQGGWVASPDGSWGADVVHLDATLTDLTPADPLKPLDWGSYAVRIHSGEVRVREQEATTIVRQLGGVALAQQGLSDPQVRFLKDGRVRVAARLDRLGVPWPISLDFRLKRHDAQTLRVEPQLSLLHRGALGLLGRDLLAEMAAAVPGARRSPDGALLVDTRQLPTVTAALQAVKVQEGRLVMRFAEDGASIPPRAPRRGAANWVEVEARGELSIPDGNLKDAKAFVENGTDANYPIFLNDIPRGVKLHVEKGSLVVTESSVATAIAQRVPEFSVKSARFKGQVLELEGRYRVSAGAIGGLFGLMLGGAAGFVRGVAETRGAEDLGVPVCAKIAFSLTPEGQLKLTPDEHDMLSGALRQALLDLPGARAAGDGVILDLSKLAGLQAPRPRGMREDRGRLVIDY
ncbi:MAG: hypothetical protein VKP62_10195 [Candidatus Sericytochromatia bacterium]|nr:hypothetical protein [Candidatus Sericytochromatia bacterium]